MDSQSLPNARRKRHGAEGGRSETCLLQGVASRTVNMLEIWIPRLRGMERVQLSMRPQLWVTIRLTSE